MGEAIDGAAIMLFGVSLAYKESANVRNTDRSHLDHSRFCLAEVTLVCVH